MNIPVKHKELAHAWVEGAKIQYYDVGWCNAPDIPAWCEYNDYRIDPLCEYAINSIPEHNREAYIHFHNGGEVEYKLTGSKVWFPAVEVISLTQFEQSSMQYRPKPKTVKKWQWLLLYKDRDSRLFLTNCYLAEKEAIACYGLNLFRRIEESEKEFPA